MSANPINDESIFAAAAARHWQQFGQELLEDVDRFNQSGGVALFSRSGENEYLVNNSETGLEVHIVADLEDHLARYEFNLSNDHSAGVPEGGILSMRMGRNGVEFYSSDQALTASEARSLLLDPVLNLTIP